MPRWIESFFVEETSATEHNEGRPVAVPWTRADQEYVKEQALQLSRSGASLEDIYDCVADMVPPTVDALDFVCWVLGVDDAPPEPRKSVWDWVRSPGL
jgi:hypothetical protein